MVYTYRISEGSIKKETNNNKKSKDSKRQEENKRKKERHISMDHISKRKKERQQGMTIRTARLPGAGNLLGRAGEDFNGLPGRASCISFYFILLTVSYKFEKLKANRSTSKERKFVPKCRRKNLFGVFAVTTWATPAGNKAMPVPVGILKQLNFCLRLLFLGGRETGGGGGG